MIDYWHNILTEKSWSLLQDLKGKFPFILIGGWAVYFWARTHKSKDVDIIVDIATLSRLKKAYSINKNDSLRKYELKKEEIDVDIYVPYYSKLIIPPENITSSKIEGFDVAALEQLLLLKQGAELSRENSEKGEKDRVDILSLALFCDVNFREYKNLLKKHNINYLLDRLIKIIKAFKEAKYFNLNPRQIKLKKKELVEKIKIS